MRMSPYLAGGITGYIIVTVAPLKFNLRKRTCVAYWTAALIVFLTSLYSMYFKDVPSILFAMTFSVGRFLLALFWGSVLLMCHLGYGRWLEAALANRTLLHLNKLSYMMYMVNPVVISWLSLGRADSSEHFDVFSYVR